MFFNLLMLLILLILVATWVVYPVWIRRQARYADDYAPVSRWPSADILIAAHNEERCIRDRIVNLRAPAAPGIRRIWVGDDTSTDRTRAILEEMTRSDPALHLVPGLKRQGKAGILKRLVAEVGQTADPPEVLIFTDANTRFAPEALNELRVPFQDPQVGGVCGRLVFEGSPAADRELDYWARENEWKVAESRADSCLGANGAIYAIRRELFWADLPANTVIDDFVIGMKVREQGFRMVYWSRALAWEETPPGWAQEFRRRVRIGTGAFQTLGFCRRCLTPRYGRFAVMFALHKVARWVTPLLILFLIVLATVQWRMGGTAWLNGLILVGTGAGLILAAMGFWAHVRHIRRLASIQAWAYFCLVQAAFLMGFVKFLSGSVSGIWERTERG